jgi:urease accessory protein
MTDLLKIQQRLTQAVDANTTLTLPFELRQKSRLRVTLDDGREAGLVLSRGHILRNGDCLQAEDGSVIAIVAGKEPVTTVTHGNPTELARAAYHLGNRHVALQVGDGWLRYLADHVLDEMVASLGLVIQHEQAPFEPESGAYHGHGNEHGHSHSHDDSHSHDHSHGHSHSHPHDHSH